MSNLTITHIISENPKFWGKKRRQILEIVLMNFSIHKSIKEPELKAIESILINNNGLLDKQTHRTLQLVLTYIKDHHGVDTIIPSLAITLPRSSILPVNVEKITLLDGIQCLTNCFWDHWLHNVIQSSENANAKAIAGAFAFAFTLATDQGFGRDQLVDIAIKLQWQDISNSGQTIAVDIHPNEKSGRKSIFHMPNPTRLLLNYLRTVQSSSTYVFFPDDSRTNEMRRKTLSRAFRSMYLNLVKMTKREHPTALISATWTAFLDVSYLRALNDGLEPFIISAIRRHPFPVSHPIDSSLRIYGDEAPHHQPISKLYSSTLLSTRQLKSVSTKSTKALAAKKKLENNWSGASKTILKRLVNKLKRVAKKKIRTDIQVSKALTLIDEALVEANSIACQKSALHLALFWIRSYILKRSISASTINDYFSRSFYKGFLVFSDSDDLSQWDTEDHELAFETAISRGKIGEATKSHITIIYKLIYRFANKNGFSEDVDINFIASEWIGSSNRMDVIGLSRFDAFIRILLEEKRRDLEIIATTSILAFYGSLRAGETTMLSLNDVLIDNGEIYIEINRGKTPAAKRRVPLHVFAPSDLCEIVACYYEKRIKEFGANPFFRRKLILKNVPLFGPSGSKKRYTRKSLIDVTIAEVKNLMGPNFVYHSLRHSWASWTLVRWYANRYKNFVDLLAESHHRIFEIDCQAKFRSYFTDLDIIPEYNESDLVKISMVCGHLGQETYFATYLHTFDLIQLHASMRASNLYGERELNGKTISAIVPKMKTRHSQARLKDKSINGILAHLLNTHTK